MSRWIVAEDLRQIPALPWLRDRIRGFDCSRLDWIRIDRGRRPETSSGVYGRCWYPARPKGFRISCQIPGPFPCSSQVRRRPIYNPTADDVRAWALEGSFTTTSSGKSWITPRPRIILLDESEGLAFLLGHEAYHWLRRDRQVAGRNVEHEADAFGEIWLEDWRRFRQTR